MTLVRPTSLNRPGTTTPSRPLPSTFLLGAATAAFQIEGATHEDGRKDSIWDVLTRRPGAILNGHDGEVACDHYHRMREDVRTLADLGLDSYRFSVSWARVRPDGGAPNPAGLDFYSRLVDELLGAGVTPWLTLYHWDLPQALEERGGWPQRDTASRFAEYALTVHDALGDRVRHWTTLNEPWCSAFLGYAEGVHAPGRTEPAAALRAAHHLLLGHGLAVRALRERDASLELGLTLNFSDVRPADPTSEADLDAARRIDGLANRYFVEPLLRGQYPHDVMDDLRELWPADLVHDGDLDVISTPIDVLGVNWYTGEAVTGVPPEHAHAAAATARAEDPPTSRVGSEHVEQVRRDLPRTEMDWEVLPEGMRDVLVRLHHDYTGPAGVPLVVTESGAAYPDHLDADGRVRDVERTRYLHDHLSAVLDAVDAGADVRGYFVWSLLDNFEWARGYARRFGVVHVDFASQRRTLKDSGHWLASVADAWGLVAPDPTEVPESDPT